MPVIYKDTPVTHRALLQRINRKLAHQDRKLCASRSHGERSNLGAFHVVEVSTNTVRDSYVNPVALAREIGVMHENEIAS